LRRADRTKPRMLVNQGCDGSSAIIRHAHFILRLHNVSTPWRKIHTLHDADFAQVVSDPTLYEGDDDGDEDDVYEGDDDGDEDDANSSSDAEVSLTQFWPFAETTAAPSAMAAAKLPSGEVRVLNQEAEEAGSQEAEDTSSQQVEAASRAVFQMQEFYTEHNKSFIFKASIGRDLNAILSKNLLDLGTQAAEISRKNRVDQVVCMVKNCVDNDKLGYPVMNGTQSDICWKHKTMNNTDLVGYKAFIKAGAFIDAMSSLNGKAFKTAKDLQALGYATTDVVYSEDLLDFEWNKEAVGAGVKSWITLLKAWGIGPYKDRITAYLTNNAGTREPPVSHAHSIENFEAIKNALSDHGRFKWMLRE